MTLVAAEMQFPTVPVNRSPLDGIETGMRLRIAPHGRIESEE